MSEPGAAASPAGAVADLSEAEVGALNEALDDEHRAWAIYDQVICDFGEARPFARIVESEARHIRALAAVMRRHGVPVPENPWPGKVDHYESVSAACEAAVAAEIANRAHYERLLAAVVRRVFLRLQQASQERHLVAFRRCAERAAGPGRRQRRRGP